MLHYSCNCIIVEVLRDAQVSSFQSFPSLHIETPFKQTKTKPTFLLRWKSPLCPLLMPKHCLTERAFKRSPALAGPPSSRASSVLVQQTTAVVRRWIKSSLSHSERETDIHLGDHYICYQKAMFALRAGDSLSRSFFLLCNIFLHSLHFPCC